MRFVSISGCVTSNPEDGHWYWLHKAMLDEMNNSNFDLIGPKSEKRNDPFFRPQLRGKYSKKALGIKYPLAIYKDARTLRNLYKNREEVLFHFFEGGISELFLGLLLGLFLPNSKFIFNFHQAQIWADIFSGILLSPVLNVLRYLNKNEAFDNWVFTAESQKLGNLISNFLRRQVDAYPIFSIYDIRAGMQSEIRDIDLLFSPGSLDDANFSLELFQQLRSKSKKELNANMIWRSARSRVLSDSEYSLFQASNINIISKTLDTEEYRSIHERSKFNILPYSARFYDWGSSGRIEDSLTFGAYPVVPESTALELTLRDRGGKLFLNRSNVAESSDALLLATNNLEQVPELPKPISKSEWKVWVVDIAGKIATRENRSRLRAFQILKFAAAGVWASLALAPPVSDRLVALIYKSSLGRRVLARVKSMLPKT